MGILGNSGKFFQYFKRNKMETSTGGFHSGMSVTEVCVLNNDIAVLISVVLGFQSSIFCHLTNNYNFIKR